MKKTDVKSNARKEPRALLFSLRAGDCRRDKREAFVSTGETYNILRSCVGGPDKNAVTDRRDESRDPSRDAANVGVERIRDHRPPLVKGGEGGVWGLSRWNPSRGGFNFPSFGGSPTPPALLTRTVGFIRYWTQILREPIGSSIGANSQTFVDCPEWPRANVSISGEDKRQHVGTKFETANYLRHRR